jgi:hypothetical protein
MAQATGTPQTVVRTSGTQNPGGPNIGESGSGEFQPNPNRGTVAQQIQGGTLVRCEPGLIIVLSTLTPDSLQPTGLTADAIITSSVMSKISGQTKLRAKNFEVKADNGILSIHAKDESIEDAVILINLALSVADVRKIVYTMPIAV